MLSSGEAGPKRCNAEQIDGPNNVVDEHAERRFPAGILEASGKEATAGGHSLDGSEGMFGGASALSDQAWVGLKAGIHSFQGVLMQVAANKAMLCGSTSRL